MRLQQDSGDASVSAVDATSGPEVYFLDPLAVSIRVMRLFWWWMLLPVRKFTFWTPAPPRPAVGIPRNCEPPVCQTYCELLKELQSGVWQILDVREYPRVSYESISTVVACMMVTDMDAPETVMFKNYQGSAV